MVEDIAEEAQKAYELAMSEGSKQDNMANFQSRGPVVQNLMPQKVKMDYIKARPTAS